MYRLQNNAILDQNSNPVAVFVAGAEKVAQNVLNYLNLPSESPNVKVVHDNEYEALYVDDVLVDESSTLGEGDGVSYWKKQEVKYGFKFLDIEEIHLYEEDCDMVCIEGGFPKYFEEFEGDY